MLIETATMPTRRGDPATLADALPMWASQLRRLVEIDSGSPAWQQGGIKVVVAHLNLSGSQHAAAPNVPSRANLRSCGDVRRRRGGGGAVVVRQALRVK